LKQIKLAFKDQSRINLDNNERQASTFFQFFQGEAKYRQKFSVKKFGRYWHFWQYGDRNKVFRK
jgi:hypothetical protein